MNSNQMARLDFFLISVDMLAYTTRSNILPGYRTDHSLISLSLSFNNNERGKGFWKFNTSLLHDGEYVKLIKSVI